MKKSAFGLMISSVMILAACAGQKPGGEVVTYYPKPTDQNGFFISHKEITLFDLGRTISHNAVDIFDPAVPTFFIPPDDPKAISPLVNFPAHPYMLVKDDDVTVYSLLSTESPSPEIIPTPIGNEIVAPPIALTSDDLPLPP